METVQCPICFEIPEDEIYQCKDGHILCGHCYPNVPQCPQCRLPFGQEKIRCRGMESLLDMMTFECQNKDEGCKDKMKRNEMRQHLKRCVFGSRSLRLCELLGYKCTFETDGNQVESALKHYQTQHGFILRDSTAALLLKSLNNEATSNALWTPVIMMSKSVPSAAVILIMRTNKKDKSLSLEGVLIDDPIRNEYQNCQIMFQIQSQVPDEMPNLTWTVSPVSLVHLNEFSKQSVFKLGIDSLEHYMSDGNITVQVHFIKKANSTSQLSQLLLDTDLIGIASVPGLKTDSDFTVFAGVTCNGCGLRPISGIRYKCLQCEDYDICPQCMAQKTHSHHIFAMIKNDLQQDYIRRVGGYEVGTGWKWKPILPASQTIVRRTPIDYFHAECDGCAKAPITGLRYTCLSCPLLDLCPDCVEAGFHQHHIFGVIQNTAQEDIVDYVQASGKPCSKFQTSIIPQLSFRNLL